ncbi:hypothetical protein GWI33_018149 [Rhynchophorus ferrugineus]|uniref:Uncharacterized protein n=1 Tax=Rhynchophorus ferrugineus TaxID=354439 RepID=A0A834M6S1_RHYFE|nr:hypothetical protein GWI33_018149 [Rhynchophorus ferrugineus]
MRQINSPEKFLSTKKKCKTQSQLHRIIHIHRSSFITAHHTDEEQPPVDPLARPSHPAKPHTLDRRNSGLQGASENYLAGSRFSVASATERTKLRPFRTRAGCRGGVGVDRCNCTGYALCTCVELLHVIRHTVLNNCFSCRQSSRGNATLSRRRRPGNRNQGRTGATCASSTVRRHVPAARHPTSTCRRAISNKCPNKRSQGQGELIDCCQG